MNINYESSQNHVKPDFLNCKQIFQDHSSSWVAECYLFFVLLPLPCHCLGLLSEGKRYPRHKWDPPSSWPRETQEQETEGKGGGCSTAWGSFVPLLPLSIDPGCGAQSLLCHPWQMALLQFHKLSNKPPCRAPVSASPHLCFERQWGISHFLSGRLGKISFSSPFYFYPKNKTNAKCKPKIHQSGTAHELTLCFLTKSSAMLSIPIQLISNLLLDSFLNFFLFKLWTSFMLCWQWQQVKFYNKNKEFVLNSWNSSINAFLNLMTIGTYSHNITHVHISFKFFWAIDFLQKKECYKYL